MTFDLLHNIPDKLFLVLFNSDRVLLSPVSRATRQAYATSSVSCDMNFCLALERKPIDYCAALYFALQGVSGC